MSWMLDWLAANWFGVFGLLLGTIISVYLAVRYNRVRVPCYAVRSMVVIEKATQVIPDLSLHWRGVGGDLENLTVSIIAFWNAGQETIRKDDIAKADPLRIEPLESVRILGVKILETSCDSSLATCSLSKLENRAALSFDFLDAQQGVIVEVAHTGTSSSAIKVRGTIKGAKQIRLTDPRPVTLPEKIIRVLLGRRPTSFRKVKFRAGMIFMCMAAVLLVLNISILAMPFFSDRHRKYIEVDNVKYIEERQVGESIFYSSQYHDGSVSTSISYGTLLLMLGVFLMSSYIFRYGFQMARSHVPSSLPKFYNHPH